MIYAFQVQLVKYHKSQKICSCRRIWELWKRVYLWKGPVSFMFACSAKPNNSAWPYLYDPTPTNWLIGSSGLQTTQSPFRRHYDLEKPKWKEYAKKLNSWRSLLCQNSTRNSAKWWGPILKSSEVARVLTSQTWARKQRYSFINTSVYSNRKKRRNVERNFFLSLQGSKQSVGLTLWKKRYVQKQSKGVVTAEASEWWHFDNTHNVTPNEDNWPTLAKWKNWEKEGKLNAMRHVKMIGNLG